MHKGSCRPHPTVVREEHGRLTAWSFEGFDGSERKQVQMPKGWRIRQIDSDTCRMYGRVTTALGGSCSCEGGGRGIGCRFLSTIDLG